MNERDKCLPLGTIDRYRDPLVYNFGHSATCNSKNVKTFANRVGRNDFLLEDYWRLAESVHHLSDLEIFKVRGSGCGKCQRGWGLEFNSVQTKIITLETDLLQYGLIHMPVLIISDSSLFLFYYYYQTYVTIQELVLHHRIICKAKLKVFRHTRPRNVKSQRQSPGTK